MSLLVDYPVSLPTELIPQDADAPSVAATFASGINQFEEGHFVRDALWRDTFALTGTLRTFYSATVIATAWRQTSAIAKVGPIAINSESASIIRIGPKISWLSVGFSFRTNGCLPTTCSGFLSLVPSGDGKWRIWVLRTILEQLKGQPNVNFLKPIRANGHTINEYQSQEGMSNGSSVNGEGDEAHFDCVVIGGGQAGLSVGGRLQALDISYVIVDKNPEIGDSWKRRYNSARLHTTREYAHLPFDRTFPSTYQDWLTKDDLAQGYKDWVLKFGINIRQNSFPTKGTWDSDRNLWTLKIQQNGSDKSITSSYIVLAGGAGSLTPISPTYADRDIFEGTVMHSVNYTEPSAWGGKHGVVVGTANTAHDVADDMVQAGLTSVTMVQRGHTYVLPAEYHAKIANLTYNENFPMELADKMGNSNPAAVADLLSQHGMHTRAREEPERFDVLEKVGFKLDRFGSIIHHIMNRMGGHYIDVGTSKKIADGSVRSANCSQLSQIFHTDIKSTDKNEVRCSTHSIHQRRTGV